MKSALRLIYQEFAFGNIRMEIVFEMSYTIKANVKMVFHMILIKANAIQSNVKIANGYVNQNALAELRIAMEFVIEMIYNISVLMLADVYGLSNLVDLIKCVQKVLLKLIFKYWVYF